jgi:DNA-binding response OmpR family regulator
MSISDNPVRLLLVEDNPADAFMLRAALEDFSAGQYQVVVVERLGEVAAATQYQKFDVILLDLHLPDSHGLETIGRVEQAATETPIVVLTGMDDEDAARQSAEQGAQDYLLKVETSGRAIARAIHYAISRKQSEVALRKARDELERRVHERTAEVRHAHREVLRAAERERRRIGQDLHDGIQSSLAGIGYMLDGLRRRAERQPGDGPALVE